MEQAIRFCESSDGVTIAYAVAGEGPAIVFVGSWMNTGHLELEWAPDSPFRPLFEQLAANHRVIRFDSRGSGLSDRDPQDVSLAAQVRDLDAVITACGLTKVALFGAHVGGATALAFAAVDERVHALILYATAADGSRIASEEVRRSMRGLIHSHWGVAARAWAEWFAPSRATEPAFVERLGEIVRKASSPEMAERIFDIQHSLDVSAVLDDIRAPTLVIHRAGDRLMPAALGREIAAAVPHARYVPLAGDDDLPVAPADVAQIVDLVVDFVATPTPQPGAAEPPPSLTGRELDVLRRLALGRTNRQIADELVLSVYTVNRHVSSLLAKLGAANRTEALRRVVELGILPEPGVSLDDEQTRRRSVRRADRRERPRS